MQMTFLQPWAPHIRSILRILAAATFLTHGTMKLFGWPVPMGDGPLDTMMLVAAILELVGGLLLLIGLLLPAGRFPPGRHDGRGLLPGARAAGLLPGSQRRRGCVALLLGVSYIAAAGPGPISVDAQLGND